MERWRYGVSLYPVIDPDFDGRWDSWQRRARVHDRMMRTRLWLGFSVLTFFAVAAYLLLVP
jgi:hypothetical protein